MKWNKYTLKTTTDAVDYISSILVDLGINCIEVNDNVPLSEADRKAMFIDYLPILPDNDGTAYITFYTEDTSNAADGASDSYNLTGIELNKPKNDLSDEELLMKLRTQIKEAGTFINVGEATITKEHTVDSDWINNWKEFFKPFVIGSFYIKPVWENGTVQKKGMHTINIDPGIAFGTGKHETTQLCIIELMKYIKKGMSVFDVGCGSAILSVAARKLGAGNMLLTDIDPSAVTSARENFEINGLSLEEVTILKGNLLEDKELQKLASQNKFDVIVANILADVIIPLSGVVHKYIKKDGIFISSGIIYTREDEVVSAIKSNPNLELLEVNHQGDWVMVSAKCRDI
ncbi:MAG: 50S ribosomal protein L11 methyltransferase [Eubacterium sp.]